MDNPVRCQNVVVPLCGLVLAVGCVPPAPVLRLSPQSNNVVWVGGTPVASRRGQHIRAAVAFAREQGDQLAFRVEIENLADEPILVDPAGFYYTTCAHRGGPSGPGCAASRYATDPERALLELDMSHARQVASAANGEALLGAVLLLDLTAGVVGATAGHGRGTATALIAADSAAGAIQSAEQDKLNQVSAYELERSNWSIAALRKTTLFPRNKAAGLVFIGKVPKAREVSLHIRAGDDVLPFVFDQTAHKVGLCGRRSG
jgi:hypothetical protein